MDSWMNNFADRFFSSGISKTCILVFSILGCVALAVMMMLTAADVVLRYFFNSPIPGAYELTEFTMVIFVACGLSYCSIMRGHVSVDLLFTRLSEKSQAVIDCFTKFIGIIIVSLMAWRTFQQMTVIHGFGEKSQVLTLPVFPFIGIAGLGIALFGLVLILQFFESLFEVIKK